MQEIGRLQVDFVEFIEDDDVFHVALTPARIAEMRFSRFSLSFLGIERGLRILIGFINDVHDLECVPRGADRHRLVLVDAFDELLYLEVPRKVPVEVGDFFGRIPDRRGFVLELPLADDDLLPSVASRFGEKSFDDHIPLFERDVEPEGVLPHGRRGMKQGALPMLVLKDDEGVVFDVEFPEGAAPEAFNGLEVAAEIQEEIEHMDALVEEDPPAGDVFAVAPGIREIGPSGFSVKPADIDDLSQPSALDQDLGPHDPGMETMIETEHKLQALVGILGLDDAADVFEIPARRLLAEDMFARVQAFDAELGGVEVRRANEEKTDVLTQEVFERIEAAAVFDLFPDGRIHIIDPGELQTRMPLDHVPPDLPHVTVSDDGGF